MGRGCPGRFGFSISEVSRELLDEVGTGPSLGSMSLEGFSNLSDCGSMKNLVPEHVGVSGGGADLFQNTQSHPKVSSEHFLHPVPTLAPGVAFNTRIHELEVPQLNSDLDKCGTSAASVLRAANLQAAAGKADFWGTAHNGRFILQSKCKLL